jgi:hypothetical protein
MEIMIHVQAVNLLYSALADVFGSALSEFFSPSS